jgi:hypothetical protein
MRFLFPHLTSILIALLVGSCADDPTIATQAVTATEPARTFPAPPPPPPTPPQPQFRYKDMRVISQPPGARIELNNGYMGETPLSIKVSCSLDGRFLETVIVRALPTMEGHYSQTKVFSGGYTMIRNDQVPATIFFDMRLGPSNPSIDVNVR